MHTIEATAVVTPDHQLVVRSNVPDDVLPGEHRVVLVIEGADSARQSRRKLSFRGYDARPASDDVTFSREQIYGDDGR